jgi:RHS repeat-associated protein
LRYQYGNHLGSVGLEVDAQERIISYEESHPYGTSAYRARNSGIEAPPKRYRYTGMERDEESWLNYHAARYYAPSLGRWSSIDPSSLTNGLNLYRYTTNPLRYMDPDGRRETVNLNNADDFETVMKKAVEAWNMGTDASDRRNRFRAEIGKKYTHEGMSGEHAWQMWAFTSIPVDDILSATSCYDDDTAKLLRTIAPGHWVRTLDELFVPGVPVDEEALLAASGVIAEIVKLYLQAPGRSTLKLPPSGPTPALAFAMEKSEVAALPLNPSALSAPVTFMAQAKGGSSGSKPRGGKHPVVAGARRTGQEAHRQIEHKGVTSGKWSVNEVRLELRPGKVVTEDLFRLTLEGPEVGIIKPATESGLRSAIERAVLMEESGYSTEFIFYDPAAPAYQPSSLTYIGGPKIRI